MLALAAMTEVPSFGVLVGDIKLKDIVADEQAVCLHWSTFWPPQTTPDWSGL